MGWDSDSDGYGHSDGPDGDGDSDGDGDIDGDGDPQYVRETMSRSFHVGDDTYKGIKGL